MNRELRTFFYIVLFGAVGIILSAIIENLNDSGYVIDELITGTLLVSDLQIITIVFSVLLGIILGVTSRR